MTPSRTLAAPGQRTAARPGWRSDLGSALAVVVGQPYLWLIGALGFTLRGGIVLLTLPIMVLPTQVEVRQALGTNLGSTGLTSGFWTLVAAGSAIAAVLVLVGLFALARLELAAFKRLVADPETAEQRAWRTASFASSRGGGLISRPFLVQALTVLVLAVFGLPLATAIGQATLDEILRPSSSASIYLRVVGHVGQPLLLFLIALVVLEMLSARATRHILVRAAGLASDGAARRGSPVVAFIHAAGRLLRSPLRTLRCAALGWLVSIVILIPSMWATSVAWQAARASFLSTTSLVDLLDYPGLVVVAVLLAAVFGSGLLLAGFASALRAGLWSVESLR